MQRCEIKDNGKYNGPLTFIDEFESLRSNIPFPVYLTSIDNYYLIENNTFSGFNPYGIIHFWNVPNTSSCWFQNNVIMVDISGIYYNISDEEDIYFGIAPLIFFVTSNTRTINNIFQFKDDDIKVKLSHGWIYYGEQWY